MNVIIFLLLTACPTVVAFGTCQSDERQAFLDQCDIKLSKHKENAFLLIARNFVSENDSTNLMMLHTAVKVLVDTRILYEDHLIYVVEKTVDAFCPEKIDFQEIGSNKLQPKGGWYACFQKCLAKHKDRIPELSKTALLALQAANAIGSFANLGWAVYDIATSLKTYEKVISAYEVSYEAARDCRPADARKALTQVRNQVQKNVDYYCTSRNLVRAGVIIGNALLTCFSSGVYMTIGGTITAGHFFVSHSLCNTHSEIQEQLQIAQTYLDNW
eukprot:m.344789 g.344789  ORF g.344789 m.344789 type:complete len:272 (-) comp25121_c0_seq1:103-918(-)